MTRKWFFIFTVFAIAAVAVFVSNQITQAQRPDRSEMRDRQGGGRRGGFSPTSIIDSSWVDLTFTIKADDKALIQARPIYQNYRDNLEKTFKEAQKAGDFQGLRGAVTNLRDGLKTDLSAVLTEEQIAKLETLQQERRQQMGRRGGGRGRGGRPDGGGSGR